MSTPSNALNISSAGIIKFDGTATFSETTITQHDVLVGGASNAITSVTPSATSGVPLISQGASSDPAFGTAVVAGGGTGNTTFTAYSVICAGTTATGIFQNVSGVGTSGQILTSQGASALPQWKSINVPTIQKFTSSSGTYTTPTSPAPIYIRVVMVGPGGGGSAVATNNGSAGSAATTFGTSLLSAGAGGGGQIASGGGEGGTGGTATLGSGPIGIAINGGTGGAAGGYAYASGGDGAPSALGGAGGGGYVSTTGTNAATNSGSGGGGGGGSVSTNGGGGGGAGGYVDAIIISPAATYAYVVGSGGNGGPAGTTAGGNGAAGLITVYEYYQ